LARRGEKYWEHSFTQQPEQPRRKPPPGSPCPLSCNTRWRQAQEILNSYAAVVLAWEADPIGNPPAEPEVGEVRPWLGDPVLCPRCQSQVRQELAELSDLAAIADAENTGHRHGPDADRISGSKAAPSPSPVADDLDELASILRDWQAVALGMDETPARTGFLMSEIATLCARLSSLHFTKLMSNADVAASFAEEVRQWHKRLTGQTKAGTGVHHKPRPCPRCSRMSLTWRDGTSYVSCSNPDCARMMSLDEWRAYDESFTGGRGVA